MSMPLGQWIVNDNQCVPGLGRGELLQSETKASAFLARIVLNSYESNCLRDWLAQRWQSPSLAKTCISSEDDLSLVLAYSFGASSLPDARLNFESWLKAVISDRTRAAQSRK